MRDLPRRTYWVMYSDTIGDIINPAIQHFGTVSLETAKLSVQTLRDCASRGKHFHRSMEDKSCCINSAWIEVEDRGLFEESQS